MNILHVTPFYSCERGGERHVKEVSEHLAAGGHRVTVLTTNVESERDLLRGEKGVLPKSEIINGVHVMRISATSKILSNVLSGCERVKGGYRSLSLLFTSGGLEMLHARPGNLGFLYSILRSDADIVASWNWYFPPAYYAHLARRLRGFRLVGIPFFHTAERWSQNPVYDDIVTTCDGFIVNTEHERRFILKRMPTATRIAVVGPGTNPALFNMRDSLNFRKRYGLGDAPLIGFVGSLGIQKGADTLLEAMPLVWRWNGNVRLVLAGYESSNFSKIEQLIHGLSRDYQSRILILSNFPESEKPNLYEAIDIFALPSTSESFGIAYLEAWICRKPVIGSRIDSTACVIEEGTDGLLVRPKDPVDLARAICELLADPTRRNEMGERGYAKTLANFTWQKVSAKIERFYSEVLGNDRVSTKDSALVRGQLVP